MKNMCKICGRELGIQDNRLKFCEDCKSKARLLSQKTGSPYYHCLRNEYDPTFKEESRKRSKIWQQENYERYRENYQRYQNDLKYKVFLLYSNSDVPCCVKCGVTDIDVLSLDHINNDGWGNRIAHQKLWRKALEEKDKSKYQTLCCNCNWKKNIEYRRAKALLKYQKRMELKKITK